MATQTTTPTRFVVERMGMISGAAEAEKNSYKIALDGKGCVWLYSLDCKSPGSAVYFHNPNDDKSDGFAGNVIRFKVGKAGEYHAKGPWHSNSDALFKATGIDLRAKHLTFGAIGNWRSWASNQTIIEDVIYADKEPTMGEFHRLQNMAKKLANELNHPVCYYSESSGGSSCGFEYPEGTKHQDWAQWFEDMKNSAEADDSGKR